jgi:two-component system NtrC family sensor kinase
MKQNRYATTKKTILACMILVPVIPFILVLGVGYYHFTTSLESSTISSMKRIIEDHRQMIDSFLRERKADLEFILNSYTYETLAEPGALSDILTQLQKKSGAFVDLGLFNKDGIHVNYQGPYRLAGRDYGQEDWFKQVIKEGYYISDIFMGFRRIPHFIIAVSLEDSEGKRVLRATIDTHIFSELVKKVRIGKTGEGYILNAEGVFQTERRSGGNLMDPDPDNLKHDPADEGIRTFVQKDLRGDDYFYATTWMQEKKWLLVVRQEKVDVFRALRSAAYLITLIAVIGGGAIIGIAFFLTDRIVRRMEDMDSEKDRLGEQLIRAGRLAELGEMAAGFAHEINNPLQIMKSEQALVQTILSDLKEKGLIEESEDLAELEDSIRQIRIQTDRCAGITQAILRFGRQGESVAKDVSLQDFIPEVVAMIEKKASVHGIRINQKIPRDVSPVHVDSAQLQQVLLNLFNNAIDAIIDKHGVEGGEISVETAQSDDGNVKITVRDNGCGISSKNLNKIFSPFFTTKPVGKGTGLGLSICYGIIGNMGGVMEVNSEQGVGTAMTIVLPASRQDAVFSPRRVGL